MLADADIARSHFDGRSSRSVVSKRSRLSCEAHPTVVCEELLLGLANGDDDGPAVGGPAVDVHALAMVARPAGGADEGRALLDEALLDEALAGAQLAVHLKPHRVEPLTAGAAPENLVHSIRQFAAEVTVHSAVALPALALRASLVFADTGHDVPPYKGEAPLAGDTVARLEGGAALGGAPWGASRPRRRSGAVRRRDHGRNLQQRRSVPTSTRPPRTRSSSSSTATRSTAATFVGMARP